MNARTLALGGVIHSNVDHESQLINEVARSLLHLDPDKVGLPRPGERWSGAA